MDHTAKLWDIVSGSEIATLQVSRVSHPIDRSALIVASTGSHRRNYLGQFQHPRRSSDHRILRSDGGDLGCSHGRVSSTVASDDRSSFDELYRKIHSLIGHTAEVSSAQFNWDCSRIVTGSMDKTCKLWDTLSGQLIDAERLLDRSNQLFV